MIKIVIGVESSSIEEAKKEAMECFDLVNLSPHDTTAVMWDVIDDKKEDE